MHAPEAAPANVPLPGSRASTVHANLFDAAFSCLTRARTPFSAFFLPSSTRVLEWVTPRGLGTQGLEWANFSTIEPSDPPL